ncbi:MAG: HIT domain-containing protein [Acidimicrobiales bacterium]|jgi:ATP adenylyltransferase|nr:HIT domain-containing protein [Acidimicrobiales bacterium]HJO99777.1 HIT domain-containing protein [Acidimicrobiales bacterium]|tara:strand:- start:6516 stop:7040 length:525 start_codon:yes stop_codon:yes gene_type:complete
MSGLENLWAGWRLSYVEGLSDADATGSVSGQGGLSLFESIEQAEAPDDESFIVHRGPTCFVLMNAYPYSSGHMLVLPRRAAATLEDLTQEEYGELWATVRTAVAALKAALSPQGVNVGLNLGRAAGAGIEGHVHVHVVPRWSGDTNFTTTTAGIRVLPEALGETWRRLRSVWPG